MWNLLVYSKKKEDLKEFTFTTNIPVIANVTYQFQVTEF